MDAAALLRAPVGSLHHARASAGHEGDRRQLLLAHDPQDALGHRDRRVLLADEVAARKFGLTPKARVVAMATAGRRMRLRSRRSS